MSHHIIDRRKNQKGKSSGNRQRFLRRVRTQVREAAKKAIRDGDIESITSKKGRRVTVPAKDLEEHAIIHGQGGDSEKVIPGNDKYITGDRFSRPQGGQSGGGGRDGSSDGTGDDSFTFELTKDEFLDLFFEDLELPDMLKQTIKVTETFQMHRAGFVNEGTPARMNIVRSMRTAKGRRQALRGPKRKKIEELELELEQLDQHILQCTDGANCEVAHDRREEIVKMIEGLLRKIAAVPFVDDIDLRYNFWKKIPQPTTRAVMFCIMDVSYSMDEWMKEMAKRFFMLLYLFLTKSYERVDLVFIRHHIEAKEVDEDNFFHSKETGGTIVSTAYDLMLEIIKKRYPVDSWNIYACQASDGDDYANDVQLAKDLLENQILGLVQYFAYVEIRPSDEKGRDSQLWTAYNGLLSRNNFDMTIIHDPKDIYPVFRRLFEKERK